MIDVLGAHLGIPEKYTNVELVGGVRGRSLSPSEQGALMLARACMGTTKSFIIDTSMWEDDEAQIFVGFFLDELFRLHGRARTPRHIFVEEAEVYFPQTHFDNSRVSLHAGNKIMKRGRAYGLGMTLITQRPQDVNKKTLSQSQCTFIMHVEGIQEVEVVKKLLRSETKEVRDDLVSRITRFQQGECMVYSPSWLKQIKIFKFRERRSKHYGDTPKLGDVDHTPMPFYEKIEPAKTEYQYTMTRSILAPLIIVFAIVSAIALGWLG